MTTPATSSTSSTSSKPFKVGTTGWTVSELLDSQIADSWEQGRFEIVEGVLALMPAANFYANRRVLRLVDQVKARLRPGQGAFGLEIDVALADDRVVRADAILMTPEDDRRQREGLARRGDFEEEFAPVFVPPTLVIESLSRGHERHERVTKRRWYAEARVPQLLAPERPSAVVRMPGP